MRSRKTSEIVVGGGETVPVARLRRRRSILGRAVKAMVAGAGGALVGACGAPGAPMDGEEVEPAAQVLPAMVNGVITLKLADYPRLQSVGGSFVGMVEGVGPVIVAQEESGKFIAASGDCTHMKCPLRYNGLNHTYDCQCHGSTFEVDGQVINGPATRTLPTYQAELEGENIIIRMR